MTENNKLVPSGTNDTGIQPTKSGVKVGMPALHRRVSSAEEKRDLVDPATLPNRIVLMLDDSGSMGSEEDGKPKIEHLKDAILGFLAACNFRDTAIAIDTFNKTLTTPLTLHQYLLSMQVSTLKATGGTAMAETMERCLMSYSMTRGVIVSDGDFTGASPLTDKENEPSVTGMYADAEVPIDTVHIGHSSGGEKTLEEVARRTGGKFIKFKDVASFARSLKYLSPAMYGMLTSGQVTAEQLGADEVK